MMLINKLVKYVSITGLHIYAFLKTFILSWILVSPFYCLIIGIIGMINGTVPLFLSSHFFVTHLLISLIFNTVMFILLEIKTKGLASLPDKQDKETKEQE